MSGARGVGRRVALGGAAMFAVIAAEAGIAKAEELDGQLLALCKEARENHAESVRIDDWMEANHLPYTDEVHEATSVRVSRWHDLCAQISDTPARTPEGIRAKAAVISNVVAHNHEIVRSLCDDLMGRAGA